MKRSRGSLNLSRDERGDFSSEEQVNVEVRTRRRRTSHSSFYQQPSQALSQRSQAKHDSTHGELESSSGNSSQEAQTTPRTPLTSPSPSNQALQESNWYFFQNSQSSLCGPSITQRRRHEVSSPSNMTPRRRSSTECRGTPDSPIVLPENEHVWDDSDADEENDSEYSWADYTWAQVEREEAEPARPTRNKYGHKIGKKITCPKNLDCVLELYRRPRKIADLAKTPKDYCRVVWVKETSHIVKGIKIETAPSCDVELQDKTFLRVKKIIRNAVDDEVVLLGWRFHPSADLNPALPAIKDGVCWVAEVEEHSEDVIDDGMVAVPASEVVRERSIKLTNNFSWEQRHEFHYHSDPPRTLQCHWRLVVRYRDHIKPSKVREAVEFSIETLTCAECDPGYGVSSDELRYQWRGPRSENDGQYSFMDGFCGAGGASAGAQIAKLKIERAFDWDNDACNSYMLNFPPPFRESVDAYCNRRDMERVDVSHYSMVCKTYAPSHTTVGKNDEANEATSYCVEELLKADKPRFTTFENTKGLWTHHPDLMYPILGQYTAIGFSIKFSIVDFGDWGLPQSRRRLILIGASPGETLPCFPKQTHVQGGGIRFDGNLLEPHVGLGEAICPIETATRLGLRLPNHDPQTIAEIDRPAFSPFIRAKCVTTKPSNDIYHHIGKRKLTIRELAVIQGFPLYHKFSNTCSRGKLKEQIGNAFPSSFTRYLFAEIVAHLRTADGLPAELEPFDRQELENLKEVDGGGLVWIDEKYSPISLGGLPDNEY